MKRYVRLPSGSMTEQDTPRPDWLHEYYATVDVVTSEGTPGLSSAELTIWASTNVDATDQLDRICQVLELAAASVEIGHTSWEYG